MTLFVLAILLTTVAALSGIFAVGSGRHWQFTVPDYFRGKRNAILYLWVMVSTIFSICHSGSLIELGAKSNWELTGTMPRWLVIHSVMGVLLTCAHAFVALTLRKEVGPVDKFLWGRKRHVS